MDDFRIELLNFLESNRKRLQDAPFGLYAVAPAPSGEYAKHNNPEKYSENEKGIIKPGVLFCLKQKGETDGNEEVNPLNPYFLVYIRNDGTVRFNYTHAKHILEIFRLMCQGKNKPYEQLCEIFNANTHHGEKMDQYSGLLKTAVKEIISIFKRRSSQRLTVDRGALLVPANQQLEDLEHFELVTWLVLL